jgi:NAD(P)-dependent dehydrogenase (short-subunit alcohol dehydrogenase family)
VTDRQIALVTGASRGIGKATAVALAAAGFDVAVTARTVHEGEGVDDSDTGAGRAIPGSLDTTAAEVEAHGARALAVRMDLLDRPTLVAGVERVLDEWGRIDVLVNNAVHTGAGSMEHVVDLPVDVLETKLQANVVSQLVLVKAVLTHMLERGSGTIVNMTSAVAITDPPAPAGSGGWGAGYAMSKGAFHRLAGILAVELGERGIRAYNIEPGYVLTERMEINQRALGYEDVYRGAPPTVPAAVIAWLCAAPPDDPEVAALNGQTLRAQKVALDRRLHRDWRRPVPS